MNETAIIIGIAIAVGIVLLFLVLVISGYALAAALAIFAFAATQGFIGIVVYFAAWVFLFPIMFFATLVIAIFLAFVDLSIFLGNSKQKVRNLEFSIEKKDTHKLPPNDPAERYKWANKLPPYDK